MRQLVRVKRVLVIEHDSLHRDLLREWLEACGACAVWPRTGLEAAGDIDAILVDVACQQQAMALRLGATRILAKPFTRGQLCTALGLGSESAFGDQCHR